MIWVDQLLTKTNYYRSQTLRTVLDTYLAPMSPSSSNEIDSIESSASNAKPATSSKDVKAKNTIKKKAASSSPSSSLQSSSSGNTKKVITSKPDAPNRPSVPPSTYKTTSPPLLSTPPLIDETSSSDNLPNINAGPDNGSSKAATPGTSPAANTIVPHADEIKKGNDHDGSSTKAKSSLQDDTTDSGDPSARPAATRRQTVLRARDQSTERG